MGSPGSFRRKRPFISLNSSASIENLSSSERARARARANHAKNDAQIGCAMQLNGITLSRTSQQQSMRSSSTSTVSTTEENKALSLTAQPVVPSTSQPLPSGIFSGASIGKIEDCSFTFHVGGGQKVGSPPKPKKKRRVIISDDSDSD